MTAAGAWLYAFPKMTVAGRLAPDQHLTNCDFALSVARRLGSPFPGSHSLLMCPDCARSGGRQKGTAPTPVALGLTDSHIRSCPQGAKYKKTHDAMLRGTLDKLFTLAGGTVTVPSGRTFDPVTSKAPDQLICNLPLDGRTQNYTDFTIGYRGGDATTTLAAAVSKKFTKYTPILQAHYPGYGLLPLAIHYHGGLHPIFDNVIKESAKLAAHFIHIPESVSVHHWKKRISVALQRHLNSAYLRLQGKAHLAGTRAPELTNIIRDVMPLHAHHSGLDLSSSVDHSDSFSSPHSKITF